jgi:putative ABC transport system ATP-binding protein
VDNEAENWPKPTMTDANHHGKPVVACEGVTKEFGQGRVTVRALRGVTLDVWPGELTLLVGPSGCGKTTLLSVIAGILEPTDGRVRVLGEDLTAMSACRKTQFRSTRIGFVFQQYNLLPALSAAENAAVPLIVQGQCWSTAVRQAEEQLAAMHLGDRVDSLPAELSGGQQQRVAIARALVHDPPLIVCDEPTAALDARTGHTIMELLREVAVQSRRAVVVVTHDPRVYPFADRIAQMEDGLVTHVEKHEPGRSAELSWAHE